MNFSLNRSFVSIPLIQYIAHYRVSKVIRKHTILIVLLARGRGGLTHHLHSEASAGNRRMAMTFAKLRLIVFLRCIGLDWMPL